MEFLTNECEACTQLLPIMQAIEQHYGSKISLIGIYTPSPSRALNQTEASHFIKTLKINYPIIYDKDAELFSAYSASGWPTLILINKKGEIKKRIYGIKNYEFLNQVLQDAIAEADKI